MDEKQYSEFATEMWNDFKNIPDAKTLLGDIKIDLDGLK